MSNDVRLHQQEVRFAITNVSSQASISIDIYPESGAELAIFTSIPCIQLGANYSIADFGIVEMSLQPDRIQFVVANAPALLPVTLQVLCSGPFVYGSLYVSEDVQTTIATSAERIRIVGPGYWAVPVIMPMPPRVVKQTELLTASDQRQINTPTKRTLPEVTVSN